MHYQNNKDAVCLTQEGKSVTRFHRNNKSNEKNVCIKEKKQCLETINSMNNERRIGSVIGIVVPQLQTFEK